jgi:hypothetical protein
LYINNERFGTGFPRSRCPRCDLKTRRPRKTYMALYDSVCEEIAGMGTIIKEEA